MPRLGRSATPAAAAVVAVACALLAAPGEAATALDFAELYKQELAKAAGRQRDAALRPTLALPRTVRASEAHRLPAAPPCVWYVPEYITREEESGLACALEEGVGWTDTGRRRLKHFGGVPAPPPEPMVPEEMPGFVREACRAVHECGVWGEFGEPNQVLANDYAPGGGIGLHNDGPAFCPKVGILSLSSSATIHFFREQPEGEGGGAQAEPDCSVLLMPRSLLVFSDEAYTHYKHTIDPVLHDEAAPSLANAALIPPELGRLQRRRRLSLTVRRVENVMDEDAILETEEARAERRRRRLAFEFGINDLRKAY